MESPLPQLLSRSCTTGWFDWVWGELWLTSEGIARLSSGMAETRGLARKYRRRKGTPTVGGGLGEVDPPPPLDIRPRVATNPRNRWIPLADVHSARLRRGILNGRLQVTLTDGARVKLLWLKADPAYDVLRDLLKERLGPKLKLG